MEIDRTNKFKLKLRIDHSIPEGGDEPTVFITTIEGELYTWVPPDFDKMLAGRIVAYKYHLAEAEGRGEDLFDVFDAHSQYSHDVCSALMTVDGELTPDAERLWPGLRRLGLPSLLYVSRLDVETAFQRRGFEMDAIEGLWQVFSDGLGPLVVDAEGLAGNGYTEQGLDRLLSANVFERVGETSYFGRPV